MTRQNRHKERGGSAIEFTFILLTLVPLLLGAGTVGINMIKMEQTEQVAHEAGRMFGEGLDMSQPGNQTVVATVGKDLGLSTTAGQGNAVVILSALTYVDVAACASAGQVDALGNPSSGCTNYGKWVFTTRLTLGNSSIRSSNLGSPLVSGPNGVTVNSNGTISRSDYVTKSGAVAEFSSVNPYSNAGGNISGLPSGQFLYVAEAAATIFEMGPYIGAGSTYAFGIF
jgi:Flp pilus assembly protein TadG